MRPLVTAYHDYRKTGIRSLQDDILAHAWSGFVVSDREVFILARYVDSACEERDLDPLRKNLHDPADTLFVWYAAGDKRRIYDFVCMHANAMPKVAWHRNKGAGRPRFYDSLKLKRVWEALA